MPLPDYGNIDTVMATERCVPGPIDSCTVVWEDSGTTAPQNRLQAHIRTAAQGGLKETCSDDGKGLALCLYVDDGPVDPPPNQPATLAIAENGCAYVLLPKRKRKLIATVTETGIDASVPLLTNDTIELDNSLGTTAACWELCIDICNAWVDCPTTGTPTVSIPPITTTVSIPAAGNQINVPDSGGLINTSHTHDSVDVTHSHGTINVTPAPKAKASLILEVNGERCAYVAADNDFQSHSGRMCYEISVPAGTVFNVPIEVRVSTVTGVEPFTASTGSLKVTFWPVACAEDC